MTTFQAIVIAALAMIAFGVLRIADELHKLRMDRKGRSID